MNMKLAIKSLNLQFLFTNFAIFLIFIGCINGNPKTDFEAVADTIEIQSQSLQNKFESTSAIAKAFDWTKTKKLKQKLLSDLRNTNHIDKTLISFLNELEQLEYAFNDILITLPSYDSLNTLAYSVDGLVYDNAINFERLAEKNGFSIAQSEGMIFLTMNTNFVKSEVMESLDPLSAEFLNLYCSEIDSVCCSDGAIIISEKELVLRAFLWGNLTEKSRDSEYYDRAKFNFYNYISLIYIGLNNTPSFDYDSGIYNKNLFNLMNEIIDQYPNSLAAEEFKEYTEILVEENFKQTDKVMKYVNEKIP